MLVLNELTVVPAPPFSELSHVTHFSESGCSFCCRSIAHILNILSCAKTMQQTNSSTQSSYTWDYTLYAFNSDFKDNSVNIIAKTSPSPPAPNMHNNICDLIAKRTTSVKQMLYEFWKKITVKTTEKMVLYMRIQNCFCDILIVYKSCHKHFARNGPFLQIRSYFILKNS